MANIQSSAYRGKFMRDYVNKTVQEILDDVSTVFGPGATDAYITKNGQPYYTRDGLELLESIKFDNPLSEYVRKILYQAAYHQGKRVGDGTTTLIVLYCNLYKALSSALVDEDGERDDSEFNYASGIYSLDHMRSVWTKVTGQLVERIKKESVPVTKELLLPMLYTCTQDAELAVKLHTHLADPLMNEAYIIVNKSNVETDFNMTSYELPMIKATRLFTVRPMKDRDTDTVIFHCNGMLDIAHSEVLWGMMAVGLEDQTGNRINRNVILLCNGITDVTRKATKELVKFLNKNKIDPNQYSNVAIYALDEYREMSSEEIEDLSTMITEERGIGGLVNSITFEALLYQAFNMETVIGESIEDLATFDCDIKFLDKLRDMYVHAFPVTFNDEEGLLIERPLGPVSQERYHELIKQIEEEKSEIAKIKLNKRLKRTYGQFIELEVGSRLLKDSQRKFELILDAVLSSAEAVRHGVSRTNLLLSLYKIIYDWLTEEDLEKPEEFVLSLFYDAVYDTIVELMTNYSITTANSILKNIDNYDLTTFDLVSDEFLKTTDPEDPHKEIRTISTKDEEGNEVSFPMEIVEPIQIMSAILENSTIPMELAMAKVFHVDSFMQNYI